MSDKNGIFAYTRIIQTSTDEIDNMSIVQLAQNRNLSTEHVDIGFWTKGRRPVTETIETTVAC
jgi:hypothetical protein